MKFLPFEIQLPAKFRIENDAALRIDFGVGAEVRGIKGDVLRRDGVGSEIFEKDLILAPDGNRIYLCNAPVETGHKQLVLRETVEKLLET